jgi:hypothetical protein
MPDSTGLNYLSLKFREKCLFHLNAATKSKSMHQSQHHNIFELEASASAGCTQCSIFYNQLSDSEILKLRNQTPNPVAEMCGPTLYHQPNLWHQIDMDYIYLTYRKANDDDTVGEIAFVRSLKGVYMALLHWMTEFLTDNV